MIVALPSTPQATPSLGNVNYAKTGEPAHKAHGVGICLVMDSLYMSLINWNGLQRPITRLDHGDKVAGHAVMQVVRDIVVSSPACAASV